MDKPAPINSKDAHSAEQLLSDWANTKKQYLSMDKGFWPAYAEALHKAYYIRLPEIYSSLWDIALNQGSGAVQAAKILIERFDPGFTRDGASQPDSAVAKKLGELLRALGDERKVVDVEQGVKEGASRSGVSAVEGFDPGP